MTRTGTPQTPLASLMHRLEEATPLDPATRVGDRISGGVVANETVRNLLQGAWLGHALHPFAVELPIGTWISAAALTLAGEEHRRSAQLLTGVGVLAAVPAALSGWSEYAEADRESRRVAVSHAGAAGAATAVQLLSWVARSQGRHTTGSVLGLVGTSLAGAAGMLGGHLAIGRKVGTRDASIAQDTGR